MRYGFFHGIDGDAAGLAAARRLLADCDRIVCLGGLVGPPGSGDAAAIEQLDRIVCLAGPAERRRAADPGLPEGVRARLRALPEATVVDGIAAWGLPRRQQRPAREVRAPGGAPRIVAPLAVAAGVGPTRLWRAAGGLCRVEELEPGAKAALGSGRVRLELGRCDGGVLVAVVDRTEGTIELRRASRSSSTRPASPPRPFRARRRRPFLEQQLRLAV